MTKPYLIFGLELLLLLVSAYGIILPEHNCSEYFTYGVDSNRNFIGLFTAPKAVPHVLWNVSFVWQGTAQSRIAFVDHFPSRMEAVHNMNMGLRSQIYVGFYNIDEQLPKLVHLEINNETLCDSPASEYRDRYELE
ncbi:hypothetical protein KR032_009283 [Drosophila birchii]|nr:hypothetical protein KR032_009283 [Drosophila birchii]